MAEKISVALEEIGIPYRVQPVDMFNGEQFDPAFLKVNPNSRIPAIVDPAGAGGEPISVLNPVRSWSTWARKPEVVAKEDLAARVPVLG